jgi:hypothetical protein
MTRRFLHFLLLVALLVNAIGSPWAMAAHGSQRSDALAAVEGSEGAAPAMESTHHAPHSRPVQQAAQIEGGHAHHGAMVDQVPGTRASDCAGDSSDGDISCCGESGCQCGCLHSATPLRTGLRMILSMHQTLHLTSGAPRLAASRTQPPFRPPAA